MNMPACFKERVWLKTAQIPRGRVSSYAEIAKAIGKPRSARAVGNALNKNKNPFPPCGCAVRNKNRAVPCHRVVRSDARVGGFARGTEAKAELLHAEGIAVSGRGERARVTNFKEVMHYF
ncbi:MAG: MGMT family protein [Candidatus Diapherotrites archaeon]